MEWLNKEGYLPTDHCAIALAWIEDTVYKAIKVKFLENVYQVDMSCFINAVIDETLVDVCPLKIINY